MYCVLTAITIVVWERCKETMQDATAVPGHNHKHVTSIVHMFHAIWEFTQFADCVARSENPPIVYQSACNVMQFGHHAIGKYAV